MSYGVTFTVDNCSSSIISGSLPWAVNQANSQTESVFIGFNIPTSDAGYVSEGGVSFWRIELISPLIILHNNVYLKGSTQSINQSNTNLQGPEIELTASISSSMEALIKIQSVNRCTIEGLAINNSPGNGILMSYGNYNHITNNFIGTTVSGEAIKSNSLDGIMMEGGDHNTIGGNGTSEYNVISGNGRYGIQFFQSTANLILKNKIGTSTDETKSLGNTRAGIYLYNQSKNQTIEANAIANNGSVSYPYGILADGAMTKYNAFYKNRIFNNYNSGIKLLNSANGGITPPQILSAESYIFSANTYISGTSEQNARIDIFEVETPEADTAGEGKIFICSTEADSMGNWLTYVSYETLGKKLTATQTDINGNTSQFSMNFTVGSSDAEYKPDMEIGLLSDESDYIGEQIINSSGVNQTKTKNISAGQKAIFYIRLRNNGATADSFVVSGPASNNTWEVLYYDSTLEGNDITSSVTSTGWNTISLSSGEAIQFRMEIRSLVFNPITNSFYVTAYSATKSFKKDTVGAYLSSTVLPEAFDHFTFIYPDYAYANQSFVATFEARNSSNEITIEVGNNTLLSVDYGTVSPESIDPVQFSDDGVWSGNIVLSKPGRRKIIATTVNVLGSFEITVLNSTAEFSNADLGVNIIIPSGACSSDVSIQISEVLSLPSSPPTGLWQAGKIIEITSNVTSFLLPLTITLPLYHGAKTPSVYYWTGSSWGQSGLLALSNTENSITFTTTHLTEFVPFSSSFANQYIFGPNPYNPNKDEVSYFWYWLNFEKNTSIYIADITGNLLYKKDFIAGTNGARGGINQVSWDGKNNYGEVLDNGVYIYKIVQDMHPIASSKILIFK